MQALKALVIVMGIAIVAGFALVVYGIVAGTGSDKSGFGTVELPLPAGCEIAAAESDGERLVVRLDGLAERGCQQVLLVDLESGRVLGRLSAVPAP